MSEFSLQYTRNQLPGTLCTACAEEIDIGGMYARVILENNTLNLHRDCSEQLALLLYHFLEQSADGSIPRSFRSVN